MYAPSGLLRADNSSKPSYRELQRLIHEEWTSQRELHTDENGVAELAGFRGTYSLHTDRAQAEVQLTAQPITHNRGGFCCRIAIHEEARWNIEPVTSRAFAAYGRVVSGFEEECAALVQAVTEHTPLTERLAYIGLTGENTDVSVQL